MDHTGWHVLTRTDTPVESHSNRALIQRYCDAFERGDIAALDDLVDPDVVDNNAYEGQPRGIEGYRAFFRLWHEAFPDLKLTLDLTISESDLIAYRWTASGTHLGVYQGYPPTGRAVRFSAISINRIRDGRIVEEWIELDGLGLLRQIGAIE